MLQKRTFLLLALFVFSIFITSQNSSFAEAYNNLENQPDSNIINQQATDFTVQDVDSGTIYSLSDFRGKVVVLDLFATWCSPCKLSIPYLRQIYSDYSRNELQIISVDIDESESQSLVSQFRSDEQMDWIVSLDSEGLIISTYGKGSIPAFYIIDQQGTIQWSAEGFTEQDTWPAMESTIKELLLEDSGNGNPDTPQSSKVFFIILEVGAGLAVTAAVVFGLYKLRNRFGIKKCFMCENIASSRCAKCGLLKCDNCSAGGCTNCGSRQFVRL